MVEDTVVPGYKYKYLAAFCLLGPVPIFHGGRFVFEGLFRDIPALNETLCATLNKTLKKLEQSFSQRTHSIVVTRDRASKKFIIQRNSTQKIPNCFILKSYAGYNIQRAAIQVPEPEHLRGPAPSNNNENNKEL